MKFSLMCALYWLLLEMFDTFETHFSSVNSHLTEVVLKPFFPCQHCLLQPMLLLNSDQLSAEVAIVWQILGTSFGKECEFYDLGEQFPSFFYFKKMISEEVNFLKLTFLCLSFCFWKKFEETFFTFPCIYYFDRPNFLAILL